MNQNSPNPVSPVMQFTLLLVPVVMTCFFMVYALVGWILEGRDKLNWSLEAGEVALYVCGGIVAYSVLVMLYGRLKGIQSRHILNLSSWLHIVIAILLTVSVFVTINAG